MPLKIRINKRNNLFVVTAAFYLAAFVSLWMLEINWVLQVLLALTVAMIAWHSFLRPHFQGDGLRCLEIGPGEACRADIGGVLHAVHIAKVIFISRYCAACELVCANGERVKVRVLAAGVDDKSHYRAWCRYLKTGYAW